MNEVAKPLKYCSIGAFKPSPCHTLLAYSVDSSGYETYETRFVDLNTNEPLPDVLTNTAGAVSWGGVFKTPREGGRGKTNDRVLQHAGRSAPVRQGVVPRAGHAAVP